MDTILGIKFREYGQIYYFYADGSVPEVGDKVIVETDQGQGIGDVLTVRDTLPADAGPAEEIQPILRIATEDDIEHAVSNELLGREAAAYCKECIAARDLEMKLVDVEVFFDLSKFIFYFTAPSRIDFRELVKDLVKHYRTRIELRQIGVRHETQMIGAVGNCGMVCCCRRFLRKFAPVTIKMAKEQNLFLNPAKISGICGRLLCCLSYEQENYEEFHRRCPRLGKKYITNKGPVKVLRANMFRNSLMAFSDKGEELEISLDEWPELEPRRPDQVNAPRPARRERSTEHNEKAKEQGQSPENGESDSAQAKLEQSSAVISSIEVGPEDILEGDASSLMKTFQKGVDTSQPVQDVDASVAPAGDNVVAPTVETHDKHTTSTPLEESSSATLVTATVSDASAVETSTSAQENIPAKGTATLVPAPTSASATSNEEVEMEPIARQAPAAIAMPRRHIKSTDASALRTSRGRRKRRRRPREAGEEGFIDMPDEYGDE